MKQIFTIGGGTDISNYSIELQKEILGYENFDPYIEKEKGWKDYLGEEFNLIKIPMPNSFCAEYELWKFVFEKMLEYMKDDDILIGHSLGGTFLLKYLNEGTFDKKISQIHLIAPAGNDTPLEKLGSFSFDKKLENFKKYEPITYFYFSKDDFIVPFSEYDFFAKTIKKAHYTIFEDKGHFIYPGKLLELENNIKLLDKKG